MTDLKHEQIKQKILALEGEIQKLAEKLGQYDSQAMAKNRDDAFKDHALQQKGKEVLQSIIEGSISSEDAVKVIETLKEQKTINAKLSAENQANLNTVECDGTIYGKIDELKNTIVDLWREYYNEPFVLEPLQVVPKVRYESIDGIMLRENETTGKMYQYNSGNQYAETFLVECDKDNRPIRINGTSFDSIGHVIKFTRDVEIVTKFPQKSDSSPKEVTKIFDKNAPSPIKLCQHCNQKNLATADTCISCGHNLHAIN